MIIMEEEVWRDIPSFEGFYQVSNFGRVKSLDRTLESKNGRKRLYVGKIHKPKIMTWGYAYVSFYRNGKYKNYSIHRLVAESFLENPLNKQQVNHKDGIKTNNDVNNLEFVTQSENIKHSYKIGIRKHPRLGLFGKDNPKSKPIIQLSKDGLFIRKYYSLKEVCDTNGYFPQCVGSAASGKTKTSYGYIWKYADKEQLKEVV